MRPLLPAFLLLLGLAPFLRSADGSLTFVRASSQYVEVPDFHTAGVAGEVTVEFWARADATAQQSAFMLDPDDGANRFQAQISSSNGNTSWDFGNRRAEIANPANTLGNWTHYALVCSHAGDFIRLYLNGNLLATTTVVGGSPTAFNPADSSGSGYRLRIGGSTGNFFGGGLDEFRVWNVARGDVEIRRDLFRTLTGNEPGLRLYYRFDETSGTVAANSATATGPAYHGALVNGPAWSPPARTALTVTNTNDDGPGSLREALATATRGTVIGFDPGLSGGTIRLTTGQLDIPADRVLAIDASALPGGITISGDANANGIPDAGVDSRVVEVAFGSTVGMDSLTITGGRARDGNAGDGGGGIRNAGTLTVLNSTVSGNRAGNNVIPSGDGPGGGGIRNTGTLTMVNCMVSGNRAGDSNPEFGGAPKGGGGGGINNLTTLILVNSTVSGNRAGDGTVSGGAAGGILNTGTLTVINSTLTGNRAGDGTVLGGVCGGIANSSNLTLVNSTLTGNRGTNGGGILHYGSNALTLVNTILAGNLATLNDGDPVGEAAELWLEGGGTIARSGVNLIGDNSGIETAFPAGLPNANGDFVGSVGSPLDPRLGPLAANGGRTLTRHPLPGSRAINPVGALASSAQATDQRGFPRVIGGRIDIGAVEVQPAPTLTAPRSATALNGRTTLRGTSTNATKVESKVGKAPYLLAKGVARWTARISNLKKPVTRVLVRATSIDGRAAQRTVVVRKAKR